MIFDLACCENKIAFTGSAPIFWHVCMYFLYSYGIRHLKTKIIWEKCLPYQGHLWMVVSFYDAVQANTKFRKVIGFLPKFNFSRSLYVFIIMGMDDHAVRNLGP